MAEIFTFGKHTIVPVAGLKRKDFFKGIVLNDWNVRSQVQAGGEEIVRRLQSVAPDYFSEAVLDVRGQCPNIFMETSYVLHLSKGKVRADAVLYENLGKISENCLLVDQDQNGADLRQKIKSTFWNTSGFLIEGTYNWQEQKQGLQLMSTHPGYFAGFKSNEKTFAFRALLNVLARGDTLDSSILFGSEKKFVPMDYCDGIAEVTAYLSNPTVERLHQADAPVGEFMGWLQAHQKEVDTMGIYVRLAATESKFLEKLRNPAIAERYLPQTALVVQSSIERYVDCAREIYSRLTPLQNNRMDYLCSN